MHSEHDTTSEELLTGWQTDGIMCRQIRSHRAPHQRRYVAASCALLTALTLVGGSVAPTQAPSTDDAVLAINDLNDTSLDILSLNRDDDETSRLLRRTPVTPPKPTKTPTPRQAAQRTPLPPPRATTTPSPSRTGTAPPRSSSKVETVVRFALAQVGEAYVWGADGPNSWDCSGLVMVAYRQVGVSLPHQSGSMLNYGRRVSRSELRRGDIVWPQYGHVGIYLGNGMMVHASNPRTDVKVSTLYGFYTARRLL